VSKGLIYVVDDEEDILDLVEYNLEKEGLKVKRFLSDEKVLEAIDKRKPDLLLIDLMLTGVEGLEVCKILKKIPKHRQCQ